MLRWAVLLLLLAVSGWAGGSPDAGADAPAADASLFAAQPWENSQSRHIALAHAFARSANHPQVIICTAGCKVLFYDFTKGQRESYLWGIGLAPMAQQDASGVERWSIIDGQGSVRALADVSGVVTDRTDYDAYGILIGRTGTTDCRYGYVGYEWMEALGQYYLRARTYNPGSGRFWTKDTFKGYKGIPLSLNKYSYCNSSPIGNLDPSGNIPFSLGRLPTWALKLAFKSGLAVAVAAFYGTAAHEAIYARYESTHGLEPQGVFTNKGYVRILGLEGTVGNLERPDIVNTRSREVYEIKSGVARFTGGIESARTEVYNYINNLNKHLPNSPLGGGGLFAPGTEFDPGLISFMEGPEYWRFPGWIYVDLIEPGVLVYYLDPFSSYVLAAASAYAMYSIGLPSASSNIIQGSFSAGDQIAAAAGIAITLSTLGGF